MNKRVYGVIGISSVMANWNADFSGYPKTISDGRTFGSDKALKYPMKKMWENEGKNVLYIKSMRFENNKEEVLLIPRSLEERYDLLFGKAAQADRKDKKKLLTNLMTAVDVKNFGATYAESKKNNIAITGAVQIGQGFNVYEQTEPQEQQILSPFRNPSQERKKEKNSSSSANVVSDDEGATNRDFKGATSLGTKIVSDEAHYMYPFVINPRAYKELIELGVTEGYTEDDYNNFKRTSLVCATSFATNAKEGCENEFALFVETEPDVYLPNLTSYVRFQKEEEKNVISVTCGDLIKELGKKVLAVDIYYNTNTTILKQDIEGARIFNILTQKEV
ncbi:MAG: type I CRISPR-associated protein Cas7 [Lachnospiraceae bacterium]|nr:type I CRISPR-associated protein Cas7 [Lachnospiraceae bacterium]